MPSAAHAVLHPDSSLPQRWAIGAEREVQHAAVSSAQTVTTATSAGLLVSSRSHRTRRLRLHLTLAFLCQDLQATVNSRGLAFSPMPLTGFSAFTEGQACGCCCVCATSAAVSSSPALGSRAVARDQSSVPCVSMQAVKNHRFERHAAGMSILRQTCGLGMQHLRLWPATRRPESIPVRRSRSAGARQCDPNATVNAAQVRCRVGNSPSPAIPIPGVSYMRTNLRFICNGAIARDAPVLNASRLMPLGGFEHTCRRRKCQRCAAVQPRGSVQQRRQAFGILAGRIVTSSSPFAQSVQ